MLFFNFRFAVFRFFFKKFKQNKKKEKAYLNFFLLIEIMFLRNVGQTDVKKKDLKEAYFN